MAVKKKAAAPSGARISDREALASAGWISMLRV